MSKFNMTSIFLFVQSLPQSQVIKSLWPVIPFEIKFAIFLAAFIVSYLSHRSYLQNKVATLENTVAELYKAMAILEAQHEHLKNTVSYDERLSADTTDKMVFLFTNISYLQKALYKKLDLEEKYRDGKKEGTTKNRQQAVQEYMIAEKTVARRFNEV
jgi:hypothetical protein